MFGRILKRLGHRPWFAAAARRVVRLDRWLQRRSKGRIVPINAAGVNTLLLTTTGRRSGQPRSQPLLFVRDGGDFIVIGSNWGQAHHPAWTSNLLADPAARSPGRTKSYKQPRRWYGTTNAPGCSKC
ncbi:hypothetical protein GCM10027610_137470 [Dactylosporangium cerinum]